MIWGALAKTTAKAGYKVAKAGYAAATSSRGSATQFTSASPGVQGAADSDQRRKWQALLEYDTEIRHFHDALAPYGQHAQARLADSFLALNDRSYLPAIVNRIIQEEQDLAPQREAECEAQRQAEIRAEQERAEALKASARRGQRIIIGLAVTFFIIVILWLAKTVFFATTPNIFLGGLGAIFLSFVLALWAGKKLV